MPALLRLFRDFHVHGAFAPEWNQRYLQMSPGLMRSLLSESSVAGVQVFGKWMSERVVQQGGLPHGRICFALLGGAAAGAMRVQGREFHDGDLFVLRGGEDFEFQRPAGMQLLSVTLDADAFEACLDALQAAAGQRRTMREAIVRPPAPAHEALRRRIRAQLAGDSLPDADDWMACVAQAVAGTAALPGQRRASIAAARIVRACHAIALAEAPERIVRVDELCARVGASRRTVQSSFLQVTGTSPLAYLRNVRLNAVRGRLAASSRDELSVSRAASDAGFDHFGHFSDNYKALFGELPSRTLRKPMLGGDGRLAASGR